MRHSPGIVCSTCTLHWTLILSPEWKVVTMLPRLLPVPPHGVVSISPERPFGKSSEKWASTRPAASRHPTDIKPAVSDLIPIISTQQLTLATPALLTQTVISGFLRAFEYSV